MKKSTVGLIGLGTVAGLAALGYSQLAKTDQEIVQDSITFPRIEYFVNPNRETFCVYGREGKFTTESQNDAGITIVTSIQDNDYIREIKAGWGSNLREHGSLPREEAKKTTEIAVNTWSFPLSRVSQPYKVIVTDWSEPTQTQTKVLTWDYITTHGTNVGFPKPKSGCPQSIDEIAKKD